MASKRKTTLPDGSPVQHPVPPREPPSRIPAIKSVFNTHGLAFEEGPDPTYPWTVERDFLFWPVGEMWRSRDSKWQGYGASGLVRAVGEAKAGRQPVEHLTVGERQRRFRQQLEGESMAAVARALAPERFNDCQGEHVVELPADVEQPQ